MFIKYRIMKQLVFGKPIAYTDLETKFRNKDKYMLAVDILGKSGYITGMIYNDKLYISLESVSAFLRYKHDIRMSILNWSLKIGAFIITIATLLLTAEKGRLSELLNWLLTTLHMV